MDKEYYYNLEITKDMAIGHIEYLRPYLDAIIRYVKNKEAPILEVGIGTGLCSIYLNQVGYVNVFGIDNNELTIEKFYRTKNMFITDVEVAYADAFNLTDVKEELGIIQCVHHQGLLEHFPEEDIYGLLDHHIEITDDVVVFAVPLDSYKDEYEYDENENRWPLEKWLEIVSKYRLFEYGVFGIDHNHDQAYFVLGKYHEE